MEQKDFDSVIILTGLKASGKDVFGNLAAIKYGFIHTRVSDAIRAEARLRGIADPSTAVLQDIGNEGRQKSGDGGYWPKQLLKLMYEQGQRRIAINGIRHPDEALGLKAILGSKLTHDGPVGPLFYPAPNSSRT